MHGPKERVSGPSTGSTLAPLAFIAKRRPEPVFVLSRGQLPPPPPGCPAVTNYCHGSITVKTLCYCEDTELDLTAVSQIRRKQG